MSGREPLEVRYNERLIARVHDHGMGVCSLHYDDSVDAGDRGASVSVRLPPRAEPYTERAGVGVFLNGLLPEDWVRDQLASLARIPSADTFGLLVAYGKDCAGALSFVDPGEPAAGDGVRWLSDDELARTISSLRAAPLGVLLGLGARISLGGVQEKMVVVRDGAHIGLPLGTTASTHILKPTQLNPDGSELYPGIVAVEHYCMALARQVSEASFDRLRGVSFTAAHTDILRIADRDVLGIRRYDRTSDPVQRIHQEDGCQALGLPPGGKYQKLANVPPSFVAFADVLRKFGADPIIDLRALFQQIVFSVCVGNADLHAKNLSLVHDNGVRLAPVYDVLSTASFVGVNQELGLRIGSEYHIDDVDRTALLAEAAAWGLGTSVAGASIAALCAAILESADVVREALRSSGVAHARVDDTCTRVKTIARRLMT